MKRIFITIYILLLASLFLVPFVVRPLNKALFKQELMKIERDFAKGTFFMLEERLWHLSPMSRQAELRRLQSQFGFPINLVALSQVILADPFEREELLDGGILGGRKDVLVKRLGNTEFAVTLGGPWPDKELNRKTMVFFLLLFVIALTVPAFVWSFIIMRGIRNIEASASRFVQGDQDARVKISRVSSMQAVAKIFNTMAEKTQKLMDSQKEMANAVSHEIRTPLSRIRFSLEMAGDSQDPEQNKFIKEISTDVEEIEALVDEMLTYARFEREPEMSGRRGRMELVAWLEKLVAREEKTVPEKGLSFSANTQRCVARFEPVYLDWAVRNLVRNALKHCTSCVQMHMECRKDSIHIHVDDDGPGIPFSHRENVFEPFFRLDQSRNRESGGYGLGLAIAKRIAGWHKGDLKVTDSPLGGARFTLSLSGEQENQESELTPGPELKLAGS